MITGFVWLMMLIIEYLNVLTGGAWQHGIIKNRWMQYVIAVILGGTPGCLGAFAAVAMCSHGVISIGALVAAMIATSGDEAFVMLAMFPEKALLLMAILMFIGFAAGWLTDSVLAKWLPSVIRVCDSLVIHTPEACECYPKDRILDQWRHLSLERGVLSGALIIFAFGVITGTVGPQEWDWKRITIIISSLTGLFIVGSVPEHFLHEHLWKHIALKHIHRVFLWTFGALLITHYIVGYFPLENIIQNNPVVILVLACLLGIIPESGPNLIFVTFYAQGIIPFGILLANSIVQDGHGMLPLLAHSRKAFILVKTINLAIGILIGLVFHLAGW
jgi:hypothetical protein